MVYMLNEAREKYITKTFWLSFQVIFIFGIPAIIGTIIGMKIDSRYNTHRLFTVLILLGTFIFSWIIIAIQYRHLNKELKKINGKENQ